MFQCITCHGELIEESPCLRICSHCGNNYPIIDGIDIFIIDAVSSLQGYIMEMNEANSALIETINSLSALEKNKGANDFSERSEVSKRGMLGNIKVQKEAYQPITAFMQNQPGDDNVLAWSSVKTGTTYHDMLPYFYQDWFGTPDFGKLKTLICAAITEHCTDRRAVAVLGAGACGLLHSVADYFQVSYGVDLSLPTLLAAKTFIQGKPLVFHLPDGDWKEIALTPPRSLTSDIHYLTTNVMNMPFKNNSLSLVITQYMLDIVSNPAGLAQEIRRVLKPDGLWINFSKPFRAAGDPPELGMRKLAELPMFFKKQGFDVVNLENTRFAYLNIEKVSPEVDIFNQLVHFFTVKKNECIGTDERYKSVTRFFKPNSQVWSEIPRIVHDRGLVFSRRKSFDGKGSHNEWLEIGVMGHTFSIPPDFAILLETIFEGINGQRSLRELFLIQEKAIGLTEESFLHLIYILNVLHYLIELDSIPFE
jgi:SAM-dependent methyltransferase